MVVVVEKTKIKERKKAEFCGRMGTRSRVTYLYTYASDEHAYSAIPFNIQKECLLVEGSKEYRRDNGR
jgi:hypothetical protein